EIQHRVNNVGDLTHVANRMQGIQLRGSRGGMHRCPDDAWCDSIHTDTSLCVFDGERSGRGIQAALRSDVRTDGTFARLTRLVVSCTTWPLLCFSISAIANCVMWKKPERLTPRMAV